MKTIKPLLLLILFFVSTFAFSQKVLNNGRTYEVKENRILVNGDDVTESFTEKEKEDMFAEAKRIQDTLDSEAAAIKKEEKQAKNKRKCLKKPKNLKKCLFEKLGNQLQVRIQAEPMHGKNSGGNSASF